MRQERWQCLFCEAQNNLYAELCSTCGNSCYDVSDSDAQRERPPLRRREKLPVEPTTRSAADDAFELKIQAWAQREEAEAKAALDPRRKDGSNIVHWKLLLACAITLPLSSYLMLHSLTSEHVIGAICDKNHRCTRWEVHGFTPMVLLALSWLSVIIAAGAIVVDHFDRRVHTEVIYYRIRYIGLTLCYGLQTASMVVGVWLGQITFLPD